MTGVFLLSGFVLMTSQVSPPPSSSAEAERLLSQAASDRENGDFEAAEVAAREAAERYREASDPRGRVHALSELAAALQAAGKTGGLIEVLRELRKLARSIGDGDLEVRVLANLGLTYGNTGDHGAAAETYGEAAALAREGTEGKVHLLNGWGFELLLLGEGGRSRAAFRAGLAQARLVESTAGEIAALRGLALLVRLEEHGAEVPAAAAGAIEVAVTHLEAGETEAASRHAEQALALVAGHGLTTVQVTAHSISLVAAEINEDWESVLVSSAALEQSARHAGDQEAEAMALSSRARATHELGRPLEALELYRQAEELARASGLHRWSFSAAMNEAALRLELGQPAAAYQSLEGALETAREHKDASRETRALSGIAALRLFTGHPGAEKGFDEVLARARDLADPELEASARWSLGALAYGRAAYEEAISHFEAALGYFQGVADPRYDAVSRGLSELAHQGLALAWASRGDDRRALAEAERLAASAATGTPVARALALETLGFVHWRAGRLPEAEELLARAVAAWEQMRSTLGESEPDRISFLDLQSATYDLLQRVRMDRGAPERALETVELARARALYERLAGESASPPGMAEIQTLSDSHSVTFLVYSLLFDPLRVQVPGRIRGAQQTLEDELLIWVVRPNANLEVHRVDLAAGRAQGGSTLGDLIRLARAEIQSGGETNRNLVPLGSAPPTQGSSTSLARLHQLLVEPVAKLLPSDPSAPVVIVAYGPLLEVPFAALRDAEGRFLVERHTLLAAPSIAVFSSPPTALAPGGALVVGDPLGDLPAAREEAVGVASRLGCEPLIGPEASETAVRSRLAEARWVHFATHGSLGPQKGDPALAGALQLAATHGEDGLLTAREIADSATMAPNLVVLSACDSGRGAITAEGVLGLARSFLSRGAAAVLVSSWRIPDAPTLHLMSDLYRELGVKPDREVPEVSFIDIGRALRRAMLAAIGRGAEPKSWAGFQVLGRVPRSEPPNLPVREP